MGRVARPGDRYLIPSGKRGPSEIVRVFQVGEMYSIPRYDGFSIEIVTKVVSYPSDNGVQTVEITTLYKSENSMPFRFFTSDSIIARIAKEVNPALTPLLRAVYG